MTSIAGKVPAPAPTAPTPVAASNDEFVIRVELNMPPEAAPTPGGRRPPRGSRLWVREKKGKRWVENDYLEVLALLRKL